jgi:hypothetical protein
MLALCTLYSTKYGKQLLRTTTRSGIRNSALDLKPMDPACGRILNVRVWLSSQQMLYKDYI